MFFRSFTKLNFGVGLIGEPFEAAPTLLLSLHHPHLGLTAITILDLDLGVFISFTLIQFQAFVPILLISDHHRSLIIFPLLGITAIA